MSFPKPQIIGDSDAINKIVEITRKVSNVDLNVLITGESGVGKELVARSLHYYSDRRNAPFVKVNCATLPSELLESELFGYEKGAFTGADRQKLGKFELAKEGSIFLDEIGEMPIFLQAKLLQVLQDRIYHRVGGNSEVHMKARIIAATNINLDRELACGQFRDDLYYRLSTISIHIPPLRDRKEDLDTLVEHFLHKQSQKHELTNTDISPHMREVFRNYHWPGNVRELENYLNRLLILGNEQELEAEMKTSASGTPKQSPVASKEPADRGSDFDLQEALSNESFPTLKEVRDQAVRHVEKTMIERVLYETRWNRKEASRILQISYRALLYKMKDLDIAPPGGSSRNRSR
jgi:transcriptional regulator with PAS, ATPase and Fis domain